MKIALVSFLNTMPFIDGLIREFSKNEVELQRVSPSACAKMLASRECSVALVPIGALPGLQGVNLMTDWCIGSNGHVDSVFLFSEKSVKKIEKIILDPDSRTSNLLVKILAKNYWRIEPEYENGKVKDSSLVTGTTGMVGIGDWAYKHRLEFGRAYDLSVVWREMTGLPFVFAVWAYHPELVSSEMLSRIRSGLESGVERRFEFAGNWATEFGYDKRDAVEYLGQTIQYKFDRDRHQAMDRFFREAKLAGLLPEIVEAE